MKRTAVSAVTYTALGSDFLIACTSTDAQAIKLSNWSMTSESSATQPRTFVIKDEIGTGTKTVTSEAGSIDGVASVNVTAKGSITVYSNGTSWFAY